MPLEDYRKKRNFTTTPEPDAAYEKSAAALRFVIQRHQARRLHYDLRLEMEGVLKSWAVPKGPSLNPRHKRLAVQTEDHPVKYLHFQGTIPKGNYGAGEMHIWDEGTYEASGGGTEKDVLQMFQKGNLKITFFGTKIRGDFALVQTERGGEEKNHWLLIKKKDSFSTDLDYSAEDQVEAEYSESSATLQINQQVKPMLATKADKIFNDPHWIYELKWDGYRAIANINDGQVDLHSRNGISYNSKYREIVEALKTIPHTAILDGEIVVLDHTGKPVFQALQNYRESAGYELRYYVFDLLHLNGHDVMHLPLIERKSLLPALLEEVPQVYYCDHIENLGKAFYDKAIKMGMEGVIAKAANSTYHPGVRSEKWLKFKAIESQEAIICGFTESNTADAFGSLILGLYEQEKLKYIGNCGTGFSADEKTELYKKFVPLITEKSPFEKKINLKGRKPVWMHPQLICEVQFAEWTCSHHLRHPSFKGLRHDKITSEVDKEKVIQPEEKSISSGANAQFLETEGVKVPISNLEKLYWPESGLRKYDLIDYYLKISDVILPFLKDRPQNLHRHPNGINAPGFYQKDATGIFPHWLETVSVASKSNAKNLEYVLCQKEADLLYLANLGCIELNPWNSRKQHLLFPDYTVIDLDPSEKNTFEEVIEVALAAQEVLEKAKIKAYPKTSGSSGIHIYIPLGAKYTYDEARDFTKILCYFINEKLPELTSMERNVKKRGFKIYLDYLQNRRGQTLAAAYCARPKPGATVSAPLEWQEVKPGLEMQNFNIKSMPERIKRKPHLFSEVLEEGVDLTTALENLSGS